MEEERRRIIHRRRRLAGDRRLSLSVACTFHSSNFQETDKATIDVEAQDDGIMGKIIVCNNISLLVSNTQSMFEFRNLTGQRTLVLARSSQY